MNSVIDARALFEERALEVEFQRWLDSDDFKVTYKQWEQETYGQDH